MFDIGFWELALIAVVALLVVGPERLPRMAREVGLWTGKLRRYVQHVRDDIEREIQAEELKQMIRQPDGLEELEEVVGTTRETLEAARSELEAAEGESAATEPPPSPDGAAAPQPSPPGGEAASDDAGQPEALPAPGPGDGAGEERPAAAGQMFEDAAPQPAEAAAEPVPDERRT